MEALCPHSYSVSTQQRCIHATTLDCSCIRVPSLNSRTKGLYYVSGYRGVHASLRTVTLHLILDSRYILIFEIPRQVCRTLSAMVQYHSTSDTYLRHNPSRA